MIYLFFFNWFCCVLFLTSYFLSVFVAFDSWQVIFSSLAPKSLLVWPDICELAASHPKVCWFDQILAASHPKSLLVWPDICELAAWHPKSLLVWPDISSLAPKKSAGLIIKTDCKHPRYKNRNVPDQKYHIQKSDWINK